MTPQEQYNQIVDDIISKKITEGEGVLQLIAIGMLKSDAWDTASTAARGGDLVIIDTPSKKSHHP